MVFYTGPSENLICLKNALGSWLDEPSVRHHLVQAHFRSAVGEHHHQLVNQSLSEVSGQKTENTFSWRNVQSSSSLSDDKLLNRQQSWRSGDAGLRHEQSWSMWAGFLWQKQEHHHHNVTEAQWKQSVTVIHLIAVNRSRGKRSSARRRARYEQMCVVFTWMSFRSNGMETLTCSSITAAHLPLWKSTLGRLISPSVRIKAMFGE